VTDGHSLVPNTNYKIICEDFVDAKRRCNFVNWESTVTIFKIRIFSIESIIFKIRIFFGTSQNTQDMNILTKHHLIMARQPHAGCAGCGGGGRGGCGGRFLKRKEPSSLPCKGGEVRACKDLEGHIFTIGSGNKGKDGDMLRTSMEKMATYIGTKYGNKAAQEWTSGKKIVLQEPAYSQAILVRHADRVKATRERIQLRLKSLRAEKTAIEAKIISAPTNCGLLKELREVGDQIAKGDIKLKDEVEMKLTNDEKTAHSNAWRTHCESSDSLKKSRGKIYSLLLGQCTQVLVDKIKQDADWQAASDSYDPLKLLKLIEKSILKQSDTQYKIGIIIEQLKLLLAYWQDDGVTNAVYYDQFKTRVDVAEHNGVSFDNPTLWDWKSQELYVTDFDLLSDTVKEDKVKDDVKQAYLAYLFFINSNDKKHSQLKKTVANDHAKGDGEAFPSSCHAALTLMNDFKPLVVKATAPVASQGTAFAQKQ
jgi:hypothetical protein